MKKILVLFLGVLLLASCEKEAATPIDSETDSVLDFRSASKRLVLHNTGSSSNPWEVIEVSDMAYQKAHQGHGDKVIGDAHAGGIIFDLADHPTDLDGNGTLDQGLVAAPPDSDYPVFTWAEAISLAHEYQGGGYNDWFLPSKDELNLIWVNLHRFGCDAEIPTSSPCETGIGGFASDIYWSSTEYAAAAWYQDFFNGNQGTANKHLKKYVRAVRTK